MATTVNIYKDAHKIEDKGEGNGLSPGYKVTDTKGHKHLLKAIIANAEALPTPNSSDTDLKNRISTVSSENVTEFIAGELYNKLILQDNSYPINLARVEKQKPLGIRAVDEANKPTGKTHQVNNEDLLFLDIKLVENVENLVQFTKGPNGGTTIGKENLDKITDFEKVIAACNILGEKDFHGANLLVDKKNNNKIVKIDHGLSFLAIQQTFPELIASIDNLFFRSHYRKAIESQNLKFDIEKYSASFNEMVNKLNETNIEETVDDAINKLVDTGFEAFDHLNIGYNFNHTANKEDSIYIPFSDSNSEDRLKDLKEDLGSIYISLLVENLGNLKRIAEDLAVIAKFSNVEDKFKNGEWIKEFKDFEEPTKDPVLYALEHNIEIEGKNPLLWVKENNHVVKEVERTTLTAQQKKDGEWPEILVTEIPLNRYILEKKPRMKDGADYKTLGQNSINNSLEAAADNTSKQQYESLAQDYNIDLSKSIRTVTKPFDKPQTNTDNEKSESEDKTKSIQAIEIESNILQPKPLGFFSKIWHWIKSWFVEDKIQVSIPEQVQQMKVSSLNKDTTPATGGGVVINKDLENNNVNSTSKTEIIGPNTKKFNKQLQQQLTPPTLRR